MLEMMQKIIANNEKKDEGLTKTIVNNVGVELKARTSKSFVDFIFSVINVFGFFFICLTPMTLFAGLFSYLIFRISANSDAALFSFIALISICLV